jgi:hypothetical protein
MNAELIALAPDQWNFVVVFAHVCVLLLGVGIGSRT